MIKHRWISGKWSKRDANFLKKKGIVIDSNGGFCIIKLDEHDEIYQELKLSFFKRDREQYSDIHVSSTFTKSEIDNCDYLAFTVDEKGYPQPNPGSMGYLDKTYVDYFKYSKIPKNGQQRPFIMKGEKKWGKNAKAFSFGGRNDVLFVKKVFFDKFLKTLGHTSREVYINSKGKTSENTVQWNLPICNSKMNLDGTWYDWDHKCPDSGIKRYSHQVLDFLPSFKEKCNYDICLSQEYFGEYGQSIRKIIANRKMIDFLLEYGIIRSTAFLHPLRNRKNE